MAAVGADDTEGGWLVEVGNDLLEIVGVPNGVNEEELLRHRAHEKEAIEAILAQGGVVFCGKLHVPANQALHRTPRSRRR